MKFKDKLFATLRLLQLITSITPAVWLFIIIYYLLVQNQFLKAGLFFGFITTGWSVYIWLPTTIILLVLKKRPIMHPATLLIPVVSIVTSFVIININPGWVFDDWLG
ncbi:hypothetical protein [Hymenobacter edaphi]|uniref:hypothetical protein n=1 Tax=Hymenobacter edaphi TaxID=2211146 RepID=UPI001057E2D6|nr:hypothetical protein [Hymenobacter edaphi]